MDKIIEKVLKKIEDNGFEAYIVGGFVRDSILNIPTSDVDICTNALPKDLHLLFPNYNSTNGYGGINIRIKKFNIDITTYREELKYINRKPVELKYVNSLLEDVKRRDFTINALCMNHQGDIIDLVNGLEDIKTKTIKSIGDIDKKLQDDPLRILRAIRFSAILNFKIDSELSDGIKKNYKLVATLSDARLKNELNKILLSKNYNKGLELLKEYKILDELKIKYQQIVYIDDINGMWAQLDWDNYNSFTKQERDNIIKIKEVLKIGKINNHILYKYGLYISQVAGFILGIPKNEINDMFNNLNLANKYELDIKTSDIIELLNIDNRNISRVINQIIELILNNELKNNHNDIKNYLINNRKEFINE